MDINPVLKFASVRQIFYLLDEPMSKHTTFKIGGPADIIVFPTKRKDIRDLLSLCKNENIPVTVLGSCSNILVGDKGIRGVVIFTYRMDKFTVDEEGNIEVWAGVPLSRLARLVVKYSLSGLEFAYGIPGSVGGAVYMNAGAYNRQMSSVVTSTEYITPDGELRTLSKDEHKFGYRTSVFSSNGGLITKVRLKLETGNIDSIQAEMDEYTRLRKEKQPIDKPSAGSVFKRPEGYFAGKLIEDAGLKGVSIGGAMVSPKHAGFIVNNGGATCSDVISLIDKVKEEVFEKFSVKLEEEIRYIGER